MRVLNIMESNEKSALELQLNNIEQTHPFYNDDDLKNAINSIMEKELNKPDGDVDCELIDECVNALLSLDSYDAEKITERANQQAPNMLSNILYSQSTENIKLKKPKSKKRIFVIVAACFMALIIITPVVAYATGHDAFAIVSAWVKDLFSMDAGETEVDGITIIKGSDSQQYSTIEELLKAENLDIMYPSWLPDGVSIKEIWQTYQNKNDFDLTLVFSDNQLSIMINNYNNSDTSLSENAEILTVDSINYYIIKKENGKYFAICKTEHYEYTFIYSDDDILIQIIQNMKGLN